ncbi:hypothetical protein D3C77_814420 [compost metagenome]
MQDQVKTFIELAAVHNSHEGVLVAVMYVELGIARVRRKPAGIVGNRIPAGVRTELR